MSINPKSETRNPTRCDAAPARREQSRSSKAEIVSLGASILDEIVAQKTKEVAQLPVRSVSAANLKTAIKERGARRDFLAALQRPKRGPVALIAEVKKASPSAGIIRLDFDPVAIAKEYEAAGASCLSVLTDEKFFQGSLSYLQAIRQAVNLPLLRKDFIIDERQILEAIEHGADAILLIVAILDDAHLKRFHSLATEAGLAALVEVHDEPELRRALDLDAKLIGVNNRNLKSFTVDLGNTERLAAQLPPDPERVLVAESGIHTKDDVQRLARCGARAILVGESLMRGSSITAKVRDLLEG